MNYSIDLLQIYMKNFHLRLLNSYHNQNEICINNTYSKKYYKLDLNWARKKIGIHF
jgi:hypothetical protein